MPAVQKPKGFSKRTLSNRRGFLSVDFLFAMAICGVMCMLMFAFTTTMSLIQIAQYIAFSTARTHAAGHLTQEKQFNQATAKFKTFSDERSFPGLAPLLRNGWFELDAGSLAVRGGGTLSSGSGGGDFNVDYGFVNQRLPQHGVRFIFRAPVLKFNIPLVGKVQDEEDADFGTFITGLLLREPTSQECTEQMRESVRFRAIRELDSRYGEIYGSGMYGGRHNPGTSSYFAMEDNGC